MKRLLIGLLVLGSISAFASTGSKVLLKVEVTSGTTSTDSLMKHNIEKLEQKLTLACADLEGAIGELRCKHSRSYTIPNSQGQKAQASACTALCTLDFK